MKNPINNISSIFVFFFLILSFVILVISFGLNKNFTVNSPGLFIIGVGGILFSVRYFYKISHKFKMDFYSFLKSDSLPIATFNYSETEWRAFAKEYVAQRNPIFVKIGLFALLIPIIIYGFLRIYGITKLNDNFPFLFVFVFIPLLFGIAYGKIVYDFQKFKYGMLHYKQPQVIITKKGILINDTYVISYNNHYNCYVKSCSISMFLDQNCIAIEIVKEEDIAEVGGSRSIEKFYILIPKDQEIDILSIASRLKQY